MPQWIVDLFGPSLAQIVWVALVAAMVCGLAVVLIGLFKRLFANGAGIGPRTRAPRLQILDVARIDEKRKLVLVRRDEVEHLVLVGGQTDLLVEGSILRVPAAVRPPSRGDEPRLDMSAAPPPSQHPARSEANGSLDPATASTTAPARATGQAPQSPKPITDAVEAPRRDSGPQRVEPRDMRIPTPEPRREPAANGEIRAPNRSAGIAAIDRSSDAAPEPAAARPSPSRSPAATRTDPELRIDAELRPQTGTRAAAVAAVPPVAAPLKPTEPPALNPSTLAFSRATPTVAELAARPARGEGQPPQPAAPRAEPGPVAGPPP
ncbi:flagellar biosynthetic protein FliO, partial [Aurantimonas sp. 22II-16-19i]|uniref:flagellar biosynthetic protein FliO n=1 Tax=Aurantimonas sp. 22II-16-19i TaxID=1317114 RepID=UPI0009F7F729